MRSLTCGLNALLFLIAFGIVEFLMYPHDHPPPDLGSRYLEFREVKDEVSILFLGSSFTYRQIIPPVVNEAFAERGISHKAFNLGAVQGTNHEINALIERVLDLKPKKLKIVVIEPKGWYFGRSNTTGTHRYVWWHSPRETLSVLGTITLQVPDFRERINLMKSHISAMSIRCLSIGKLTAIPSRDDEPENVDGWVSYETTGEKRGTFVGDKMFADYRKYSQQTPDVSTYNLGALRKQIDRVEEENIEIVYLLPPSFKLYNKIRLFHKNGDIPKLIDLSKPVDYPQLFAAENRFDAVHLNTNGSRLYSGLVADQLLEMTSTPPAEH